MEHMERCNGIPKRYGQLLNAKVKCINDLLNANINYRSNYRYYKIAAKLIYRMLRNSKVFSSANLQNITSTSINSKPKIPKNNCIDLSMNSDRRKRKHQLDVLRSLHDLDAPIQPLCIFPREIGYHDPILKP